MNENSSKEFFDHLAKIYSQEDFEKYLGVLLDPKAASADKQEAVTFLEIIYGIAKRLN